ncbi:hypothetical protein BDV39DRAFT_168000 [Aspergillus sergii]|uniref:Uncharacterized protein n=1 Tax=Aspergillus sergii TaxID=1034303 RepID=A0A5N6XGX1_9EURO|nr:hypothetical protein BDV39DRAFT_168000 [Aspergillus sergii]
MIVALARVYRCPTDKDEGAHIFLISAFKYWEVRRAILDRYRYFWWIAAFRIVSKFSIAWQ